MERQIMKHVMKFNVVISIVITIAFTSTAQTTQGQVIDAPVNLEPFERSTVILEEPVPYTHLREADVFWGKTVWRVIDLREKMNQPLYYPLVPTNNRMSMMSVIFYGLQEQKIKAYEDDQLKVRLTYEEVLAKLEATRTVTMQRDYPPYEDFDTTYTEPFKPESIIMFRLREFWFFDKERSVLECRIMAICPVQQVFDEFGEPKGNRTLFWIYFPESRSIFAKSEVFNRHSDVERRSFDDIFFKRMFSSYIIKESNVYDRDINEYAKQLDALLESERIKNDLFVFEHDLWEY